MRNDRCGTVSLSIACAGTGACSGTAVAEQRRRHSRALAQRVRYGRADGLGVLRGGTGEPHFFFVGRMRRRMPAHALLMLRSGNRMVPAGFDAALHAISQDCLHTEQDDLVFKDAEAAARATADRFRGASNPASAAQYERLARRIVDRRPE